MNQKNQVSTEKIIGVDLHPDSFSLALTEQDRSDSLRILKQITMAPISKWREMLDKLPRPAVIVCEAGNNSFELMKMAEQLGFRTCILNSIDVGKIGKNLCKTDKIDAVRIAKIYRANLASAVWCPDEKTRDFREVGSQYTQISKDCARLINRIKGFLTQHNVRLPKGKTDLSSDLVRTLILSKYAWTESDLFVLKNYFCALDQAQIAKRNLYEFMLKTVHSNRPMRELMKLCGIRVITAFQIAAAVGDVKRFANPKKLVAYLGVAPCIHQSGCREYSTGVQRDGRYMARSLLIECAKAVLKAKCTSAKHLHDWAIRLKMRRGNNVAACALARKIAVAIWYALNGLLPDIVENEAALKKKIGSIFQELKLDGIAKLGYKTRKDFVEDFSFSILTQQLWSRQNVHSL